MLLRVKDMLLWGKSMLFAMSFLKKSLNITENYQ